MSWQFRPWHVVVASGALLLPWLVGDRDPRSGPAASRPWAAAPAERVGASFPRAAGGAVVVGSLPQRVVAASVFSTEVLLAIAPRRRIAGVHYVAADARYSAVADQVGLLPCVGAEAEQLLAVRPDLVLLDEFTKAETQALLQSVGVPVVRTRDCTDFDAIADNIRLLGWVTGCDAEAEQLVGRLRQRLLALAARAGDVSAWRIMNLNGDLDTYGRGSLLDAILTAVGARNAAAEHGVGAYRKLDIEAVLSWRPDALLVGVVPGEEAAELQRMRQDPGLRLLPCVQRERIVFVPAALLASTSQHGVEVAELVQARLLRWGQP